MKKSILTASLLAATPTITAAHAQSVYKDTQKSNLELFQSDFFVYKGQSQKELIGESVYFAMSLKETPDSVLGKMELSLELKALESNETVMDLGMYYALDFNTNGESVFYEAGTSTGSIKLITTNKVSKLQFSSYGLGTNIWQREDFKDISELNFTKL